MSVHNVLVSTACWLRLTTPELCFYLWQKSNTGMCTCHLTASGDVFRLAGAVVCEDLKGCCSLYSLVCISMLCYGHDDQSTYTLLQLCLSRSATLQHIACKTAC